MLFILLVIFLVFGVTAFNSYKKRADEEQVFRMSQDPEYRKFIEEKLAFEEAKAKKSTDVFNMKKTLLMSKLNYLKEWILKML